jgi:hypothetical protein
MAAGSADQPAPNGAQEERYGMLALARLQKDDGRSLILYSHDEDDEDDEDAGEASDPAPTRDGERA